MRILFLLFLISFLNAKELEIIKYVDNKTPSITVEYVKFPKKMEKLLKIDTKLISHYEIKKISKIDLIKTPINPNKYQSDFLLRLNFDKNNLVALLYNLKAKKTLFYKKYKIANQNIYPFMIHNLSFDINKYLGFQNVDWIKKKIVYAVYMAPKSQSIFIGDITLTYRQKIISGGLNIFPKWANTQQTEIYYTKLENQPVLYKYNIITGRKDRVFSSEGMLIVSDVKGDNLLLTLALQDQPDIYKYNVKTNSLQKLTKYVGIDVNGRFYDNNKIVFISDRLGYPNVYQKDLDTGIVSKLIYQGRNHIAVDAKKDEVVLSSRETNKAFDNNTFNLILVNKNTSELKRLTYGGKNMSPVFSKDGSTILFIKQYKFNSKLGIIRLKENKIFYFRLSKEIQSFDF